MFNNDRRLSLLLVNFSWSALLFYTFHPEKKFHFGFFIKRFSSGYYFSKLVLPSVRFRFPLTACPACWSQRISWAWSGCSSASPSPRKITRHTSNFSHDASGKWTLSGRRGIWNSIPIICKDHKRAQIFCTQTKALWPESLNTWEDVQCRCFN